MDKEKIKEDLSICYLKLITAVNGIALEDIRHDEDSVDAIIKKIVLLSNNRKFNAQISIQLKSTSSKSQYSINDDGVTYKLKVKNYNDLCMAASMPSILALLILPEDDESWVDWNKEELSLRGKMFWLSLQNNELSSNKESVTVKIPKSNVLNNISVEELLKKVAEEGEL